MRWLVEEFNDIPLDAVEKSFKTCGLGLKLDHSEDQMINSNIFDHLAIERKIMTVLSNEEDYYDERQELIQKLLSYEQTITYEQKSLETSVNEAALEDDDHDIGIQKLESDTDDEEDIEAVYGETRKLRVIELTEPNIERNQRPETMETQSIFFFIY